MKNITLVGFENYVSMECLKKLKKLIAEEDLPNISVAIKKYFPPPLSLELDASGYCSYIFKEDFTKKQTTETLK